MAKTLKSLQLGPDRKENDLHGTPDFPCEVYYTDLSNYVCGLMPDHWHNELEFGIVTKGEIVLTCNGQEYQIGKNQSFFVNGNVSHSMKAVEKESCFYSVVFHESFLAFPEQIYQKYVRPIVDGSYYQCVLLGKDAADLLMHALNVYEKKANGYEFDLYNFISSIWKCMYLSHPPVEGMGNIMTLRIQQMLKFISMNYMNNIGVDEIASSAGVSKRECFRCFKEQLNSSPNIYVMQFRMNRAAEMILLTSHTMDKIAKECGFTRASYFSTKFKEVYGMSPKEYREKNS